MIFGLSKKDLLKSGEVLKKGAYVSNWKELEHKLDMKRINFRRNLDLFMHLFCFLFGLGLAIFANSIEYKLFGLVFITLSFR